MLCCRSVLPIASVLTAVSAQLSLFSFGDSYTDTGFDINGVQPSPVNALGNPEYGTSIGPTSKGTFSGGPNYVDFLVANYNDTLVLSYNFASGGATITDSIVRPIDPQINTLQEQVEQLFQPRYLSQKNKPGGWTADSSIFSILIGINDIQFSFEDADPAIRIPQLIDAYFRYVNEMYDDGARRFLFMGVPPFDRSPPYIAKAPQDAQKCSDFINGYNLELAKQANDWAGTHPDADTSIYDFHAWMTKILDAPQQYGFQDATCSGDGTSKCIWWEVSNVHTTSTFQDLLAKDMIPSLEKLGWP
ncbi:MAG: hypothetical protein HETSPECPRED_001657 [Heterodermia speciosa]|uniref:Carbohydrate esterase family 16 protein n=1 Tax=Heterodermia speciosa TaxID=116794 RepID=A0A8H3F3Q7_9LECA|nr:MAG: hypothetical protein HETSPECPRED_001657 [Heterodermia speciosa]